MLYRLAILIKIGIYYKPMICMNGRFILLDFHWIVQKTTLHNSNVLWVVKFCEYIFQTCDIICWQQFNTFVLLWGKELQQLFVKQSNAGVLPLGKECRA